MLNIFPSCSYLPVGMWLLQGRTPRKAFSVKGMLSPYQVDETPPKARHRKTGWALEPITVQGSPLPASPGDSEGRRAEQWGPCLSADCAATPLPPCLPQDLFQTPQISDVSGKKMTSHFAKNPTLGEAQWCQMVNRVLVVGCVLLSSLILSAHKTNSASPLEANCQIKAF